MNNPLFLIALFFILGISTAENLTNTLCFSIPFLLFFQFWKIKLNLKVLFLGGLFFISGFLYLKIYNHYQQKHSVQKEIYEAVILEKLNHNTPFQRYIARLSDSKKIILELYSEKINLVPSQHILFKDSIQRIKIKSHPQLFNYQDFLARDNIYSKVTLTKIHILKSNLNFKEEFKQDYLQKLTHSNFNSSEKSLSAALLFGDRTFLNKTDKINFSEAGIMHLLAISGMHLGFIYFILNLFFNLIIPEKWRYIRFGILLLTIWLYVDFVNYQPSIIRAAIMLSVFELSLILKRNQPSIHILVLAAILIFIVNPNHLFKLGFQLSFIALLGLIYFFPEFKKIYFPKSRILQYIFSTLYLSLAAQLTVAPLSIYYFGNFPALFLISNLFTIPLTFILLSISWVNLILSSFGLDFEFLFTTIKFLSDTIFYGADKFAVFNLAEYINIPFIAIPICFIILVSFYFFTIKKQIKHLIHILFLILFISGIQLGNQFYIKQQNYQDTLFYFNKEIPIYKSKDTLYIAHTLSAKQYEKFKTYSLNKFLKINSIHFIFVYPNTKKLPKNILSK